MKQSLAYKDLAQKYMTTLVSFFTHFLIQCTLSLHNVRSLSIAYPIKPMTSEVSYIATLLGLPLTCHTLLMAAIKTHTHTASHATHGACEVSLTVTHPILLKVTVKSSPHSHQTMKAAVKSSPHSRLAQHYSWCVWSFPSNPLYNTQGIYEFFLWHSICYSWHLWSIRHMQLMASIKSSPRSPNGTHGSMKTPHYSCFHENPTLLMLTKLSPYSPHTTMLDVVPEEGFPLLNPHYL